MTRAGGRYGALILMMALLCTLLLTGFQSAHSHGRLSLPVLNQPAQTDAYHGSGFIRLQTRDQLTGSITQPRDMAPSQIVVPDGTVVSDRTISDS